MNPTALLLDLLDEAFDHKAWHGTTLLGSIRGVTESTAARRPGPGRHNIWENVVHAAYWKYAVRRRLTREKRGRFALAGSNWFVRPDEPGRAAAADGGAPRTFAADVQLLVAEHRALRAVVARLPVSALAEPLGGRDKAYVLRGIAAHDLYHAGQIQLIKRLVARTRG